MQSQNRNIDCIPPSEIAPASVLGRNFGNSLSIKLTLDFQTSTIKVTLTNDIMTTNAKNFPELAQFSSWFTRIGQTHEYPWVALPWNGVFNKVLMFERCTGLTLELAKINKGAEFPEHYHTTVQTQFLVSGRIRLKNGDINEPGAFNIIPAGQLHGPFFAVEEAITFKYFASVPVYILPDGQTFIYREDGSTIPAGKLDFALKLTGKNFISASTRP